MRFSFIGIIFLLFFSCNNSTSTVAQPVAKPVPPVKQSETVAAPSTVSANSECFTHDAYLPSKLNFCGEDVPLQFFDVRESVLRELNSLVYWHSSMIYTLQLANRHVPIIKKILKENNVPEDFVYLCIAESNLQNLTSPANAVGYWQFLQGTGKEFGLEINAEVDERYDLEKSTLAACKYFKKAYAKFGNWTMAAAAYNVGMGHMNGQINNQKEASYYNLHLNTETGRYVYRAVAYKAIIENQMLYGFKISEQALYPPLKYTEIKATGPLNWSDFALSKGTNYKLLRMFNPWIRDAKLTKAGRTYVVRIPENDFRTSCY